MSARDQRSSSAAIPVTAAPTAARSDQGAGQGKPAVRPPAAGSGRQGEPDAAAQSRAGGGKSAQTGGFSTA